MAKVSKYGQWQYPGEDTLIPNVNGSITMQGVPYPVLGIDDLGNQQMMMPGADYQFPGNSVYEIPMNKQTISDPNVIAQLIDNYKTNLNSYRNGGRVLNRYQGDIDQNTVVGDPEEQSRLKKIWEKFDVSSPEGLKRKEAWSNYNAGTDQWWSALENEQKRVGRDLSEREKEKWIQQQARSNEGMEGFRYNRKKDPRFEFLFNPKQEYDPGSGLVGTELPTVVIDPKWTPEEQKLNAAKKEFLDQINRDPLQQSLGQEASLKNPNTRAAAETYARYKIYGEQPGGRLDRWFRGNQEPSLRDFYEPNTASNTVKGAGLLGATAAGTAGLAALGTGAIMLAPEAYAAAQPFISATGAALNTSPAWAPGLTLGNALTAADVAYVGTQIANPDSDVRKSIDVAADNPNTENILGAVGQVGLTGLDLLGAGLLKGGQDLAQDAYRGITAPFKMPSPSIANPDLQMAGFSPAKVLAKIKETDYYKALSPKARKQMEDEIAASDEYQRNIWMEMNKSANAESDLLSEIQDKVKNPAFYRYMANRKMTLNNQGQGQGFLNFVMKPKREGIEKALNYTLEDGKLVTTQPSPFFAKSAYTGESIVTTGRKQIVDLKTGKLVDAEVLPSGQSKTFTLDQSQKVGKQPGTVDQSFSATDVTIGEPYKETLKNNIAYVEETIPGAKVFGSSRGVAEGGLPHLSDDYDVFISESNYNKQVNNKFQKTGVKGSAQQHDISPDGKGAKARKGDAEEAYNIDFNIIHENKDGTVRPVWEMGQDGFEYSREIELFRQNYPEEFFEATQAAVKSGNPKNIKINKTADELINGFDPTVKTIMDAYESGKPKHINRIDAYINFGDVTKVQQAQEKFAKSLVGKNGSIGKQFPESAFADTNKNKQILSKIGFLGDADVVAMDPKRMQLAINDYYLNHSILSRNVGTDYLHGKDASEAFKSWYAKNPGGTLKGIGQNFVKLGSSQYMETPGKTISGFRQLGLDTNIDDPLDFVNSVFRQTDGNYIFNEDELSTINTLLDKHFGQGTALQLEAGRPIQKSQDIITIDDPTRSYPYTTTNATRPADNDFTKHDAFLKDVHDQLGIKAITNEGYGNSTYASTLGNFNQFLDNLGYGFLGENMPRNIKSYTQRLTNYEAYTRNTQKVKEIVDGRDFKRVEGYIKGGLPKAQERLAALEKEAFEIDQEMEKLTKAYTKPEQERLKELVARTQQLKQEYQDAYSKHEELRWAVDKIAVLRRDLKMMGTAIGGGGLVGGLGYLYKDRLFGDQFSDPEQSDNTPTNPVPYRLPGGGYMETQEKKKFGGDISIPSLKRVKISELPKAQEGTPVGNMANSINQRFGWNNQTPQQSSLDYFYNMGKPQPQSGFDYNTYMNNANKYLNRDVFKGTSLTAKDLADAAQDFYNSTNYVYPVDLLLAQGQMESKLGKTLKSQHNYFNVGNTDEGAIRNFKSGKDSALNYMNLMYNDYMNKGQKSIEDLLKPNSFVNYQGNRYASNPNYEKEVSDQRQYIQRYLGIKKEGGSLPEAQDGVDWEAINNAELAARARAMGHNSIAEYRNSNWGYGKNTQAPPTRGSALGMGLDTQLPKPVSINSPKPIRTMPLALPAESRRSVPLETIFAPRKPEQSGIGKFLGNPNAKAAPLNFEEQVNEWLGKPMDKAYDAAERLSENGSDAVDNFRHPVAGMYTQQAIKDRVGIPILGDALGFLGANAMGIGHEANTIFRDERPWGDKLREAGEDIFNNFTGSAIGLLPATQEDKENIIYNLSGGNWLPDGVVWAPGQNMYFKDESGNFKRDTPYEMWDQITRKKEGGSMKRVKINGLPKNWKTK